MLANYDDMFLAFTAMLMLFAFAAFLVWGHHRVRVERQRTMQKALESPVLDDVARRQLLELLTARDHEWFAGVARGVVPVTRVLVFVGGWIAMIVGGALAIISFTDHRMSNDRFEFVMTAVVGFALVTLPIALRELRTRSA